MSIAQFRYNRDDVGYSAGMTYVRDVQTVAIPYYYKYNLTGAYPYRLEVRINTTEKEITQAGGWIYINVTYSGYLKLYLGDQLVAYDALYGWTIRRDQASPPPVSYEPSAPDSTCVPQKVRTPKGIEHRNLQKGENSYTVQVVKKYLVHEFGCGVDRTYEEEVVVGVYTVNGNSYHTRDPCRRVCGYQPAQNCGGTVYCGSCTCS